MMARTYAGILGPLAFCVVIARGLICGGGAQSTLGMASCCLFGFALIGYVIGKIASQTVVQAVQYKMNAELKRLEDVEQAT